MAPKLAGDLAAEEDNLLSAPINISTLGSNTIIAGTAGNSILVYRLVLIATVANTITFMDGLNPLSGPVFLSAAQGLFFRFDTKPWLKTTAGNDFDIKLGSANQVSGVLYYTTVAAGASTPANGYVTEDGAIFYVTEDSAIFYVQES